MNPLVSVVVIFWNAARFIEQAVDSVFSQTYPHWELLLVDDGSTDGSPVLAQTLAATRPGQVHYLTHPEGGNHGMSASRNLGLQHASGEFIAPLDADDMWMNHKLERQVAMMLQHPDAAMLYGPALHWHPDDPSRDFVQPLGFAQATVFSPPTLAGHFLRDSVNTPCPSALLLRTKHVRRVGGSVDQFRGLYEDQVLCFKLALQTTVIASPEVLFRYRQHADSCCATAAVTGADVTARRQYLDWCAAHIEQQRVKDAAVATILRRRRRGVGRLVRTIAATRRVFRRFKSESVPGWFRERRRSSFRRSGLGHA